MSAIKPLWDAACLLYFKRALREICPLHEDVPYLVRRINELSRGE